MTSEPADKWVHEVTKESFVLTGKKMMIILLSGGLLQFGTPYSIDVAKADSITSQNALRVVQNYKGVFNNKPTVFNDKTSDAPLLGNGDVGIVIGGGIDQMTFYAGKNEFWSRDEKRTKALGRIALFVPSMAGASYYMEQDIAHAEVRGNFTLNGNTINSTSWVSATDNLLMTKLSYTGSSSLPVTVSLMDGTGTTNRTAQTTTGDVLSLDVQGDPDYRPVKNGREDNAGGRWYLINPISRVRMSTKVVNTTGTVSNGQLSFTMQPGQTYTLATSFISNTDSTDFQNTSVSKVSTLTQAEIDALNQTHRNWWQDYWSKSFVEIPNKTIEKSWYGSLYLLGSSMRGNEYPPGLWGPWTTQDKMAWNGDFHLNYNYETPFDAMYPTNQVDETDCYDQPVLDWIPNGQAAATAAGFRGVYYPVAIGPLPGGSPDSNSFFNQKTNAAYAATNMIMRYYYTRDTAYAKKVYYYLKLVGAFWTNYLSWDGTRYVIYNDAQHEGDAYPQTNGVMSLGLVRLLFQGLIDMSTDLNQDAKLRADWKKKLGNLSAFPTQVRNNQTVFRYTEVGRDWNDGNSIGIQHIFPGSQIGLDSDAATKQIAYNMVDQLQRWVDENGTPTFYPAAARVGYKPTTILTKLTSWITSRSYNNMHIHTAGGGIENLNTVPASVNEMLLQSFQGKIRVFANWPANTYAKFGDFRAYGGFLVSSDKENNTVQYVRLVSENGRNATLVNPWPGQPLVIYRNGAESGTLSGSEISIITSPNEIIDIAPNGTTYNEIINKLNTPGGIDRRALDRQKQERNE